MRIRGMSPSRVDLAPPRAPLPAAVRPRSKHEGIGGGETPCLLALPSPLLATSTEREGLVLHLTCNAHALHHKTIKQ